MYVLAFVIVGVRISDQVMCVFKCSDLIKTMQWSLFMLSPRHHIVVLLDSVCGAATDLELLITRSFDVPISGQISLSMSQ